VGFDTHIAKPPHPDALLNLLATWPFRGPRPGPGTATKESTE
jgi:hypothetical protein